MRTTQLVTSYIQAALFLLLAFRCIRSWQASREKRAGHLAVATTLYGLNSLISAINSTVYNTLAGERAPRWESILSSIILYSAILAFLVFLSDFVHQYRSVMWVFFGITAVNVVLTTVINPTIRIVNQRLVLTHRGYIIYVLAYIAFAFAILGFSFLFYGFRLRGIARFRLVSIGSAFTVLFLVIGLLPLWLFQKPTLAELRTLTNVLSWIALACAPLLYVGFAPPKWLVERISPSAPVEAG